MDLSDLFNSDYDEECEPVVALGREYILLLMSESTVDPLEFISTLHHVRSVVIEVIRNSVADHQEQLRENAVCFCHEVDMWLIRLSEMFENYRSAGSEE